MTPLPRLALVLCLAGALPAGVACSGGEGGGQATIVADGGAGDGRDGGGGDGDGGGDAVEAGGLGASLSWYCPAPGATCPAGEVSAYNRCLFDRCEAALASCPCEGWIACITRCGCTDVACRAACVPTFDCLACGQAAALCVRSSGCERPGCYDQLPPDAAVRDTGGGTVIVFPTPARDAAATEAGDARAATDAPEPDGPPAGGGLPTDAGLQGTCADLSRCCDSLPSASARSTCQSQITLLRTDPLCAAALLVYRSTAMCQ
jgi:hypothetical protein